MYNIKLNDYVARKSYNKDILFQVIGINKDIYYLKGIDMRIYADANVSDLEIVENIQKFFNDLEKRENRVCEMFKKHRAVEDNIRFGKILHIDGDDIYARKALKYYKKNNIPCSVYSIEEKKQYVYIRNLLLKEKPDILILTGHDRLLKGKNTRDINNYKNSKYFKEGVIQARKVERNKNRLAIFAGACQSYYEELINSGANFASSPGRILIDFYDPLIVAQVLSISSKNTIVGMGDIVDKIKEGYRSINGIPTFGKAEYIY